MVEIPCAILYNTCNKAQNHNKAGRAMAKGRKKAIIMTTVLLLCLVLISAFLLSAVNSAKHIVHPCTGKDCRLCDLLVSRAFALKQLTQALLIAGISAIICGLLPAYANSFFVAGSNTAILVHQKIRLNN